jgi:serralysin
MRRCLAYLLAVGLGALFPCPSARAFILDQSAPDPWVQTASGSRANGNGTPATITWSIVPDGTTAISNTDTNDMAPSNLISFMNSNFGGSSGQTNLTLQPWFHILSDAFGRWSQLGGLNFVYEPHDDGALHPGDNNDGVLGVRGDIRLAGANVDGTGTVLAFTYLPEGGSDMVIDTSETNFLKNSSTNFINYRNTLMHEIGHALGVLHVSTTTDLLMEPTINTSFDGPQLDEVRAVQFFFGDANERSNGGLGNGVAAFATGLGGIAPDATKTIGAAANVPTQAISPTATDFMSISNNTDTDFYSFTVSGSSLLEATLTPRGGVFDQAAQAQVPTSFNANARNNLALTIFSSDGTSVLATAATQPAGGTESIIKLLLPAAGQYFARVAGVEDTIQLYQLSLTPTPILLGDYNKDGRVDGADYAVWRNTQGQSVAEGAGADGSFDGQITAADYNVWRSHFGQTLGSGSGSGSGDALFGVTSAVPEPASIWLVVLAAAAIQVFAVRRRNR